MIIIMIMTRVIACPPATGRAAGDLRDDRRWAAAGGGPRAGRAGPGVVVAIMMIVPPEPIDASAGTRPPALRQGHAGCPPGPR